MKRTMALSLAGMKQVDAALLKVDGVTGAGAAIATRVFIALCDGLEWGDAVTHASAITVAQALSMKRPAASKAITHLEKAGVVRRTGNKSGQRIFINPAIAYRGLASDYGVALASWEKVTGELVDETPPPDSVDLERKS